MAIDTRAKMIAGAKTLIRRRGINATTLRDVVRYTDTPRGSISFHFPGGKFELLSEAIAQSRREVTEPLQYLCRSKGVLAGLRAFISGWQAVLEASDFTEGCPILAVAIEEYQAETRGESNEGLDAQYPALLEMAQAAFNEWQTIIASALRKEGVSPARARRISALVVSSVEGALALCRASHSAKPMEDVRLELEALIQTVLSTPAA